MNGRAKPYKDCYNTYMITQLVVHILTGPPGAGKTTYADKHFPHLPHVDVDLEDHPDHKGRLAQRKDRAANMDEDFVFMTSAPTRRNKDYWLDFFQRRGFRVNLLAFMPPRMVAYQRMLDRDHSPRLARNLQRWYLKYERHRRENTVHLS